MVQRSLGNSGKHLNEDYHETRRFAREETFNIDEWGDIDIEWYDLESVDFDRKQKDSTFITDPKMDSEGGPERGIDIRETNPQRD